MIRAELYHGLFVEEFARILRLQVRADRAATFAVFVMHPVSLRMVHISR